MNFIDSLVMPQSAHHMVLLKFLLVLTYMLLIPYLAALYGSTIYSLVLKRKSSEDKGNLALSKYLIDTVTGKKSFAFIFGIIPFISILFNYAQLLEGSGFSISGYISLSIALFIVASIFIYQYKNSAHMRDILKFIDQSKVDGDIEASIVNNEIENLKSSSTINIHSSGKWGILFLTLSLYIFIGAVSATPNVSEWESFSFIKLIFSLNTLINFISFVVLSLAATSVIVLYQFFRPNSEKEGISQTYLNELKPFILNRGILFSVLIPIFYGLNVLLFPKIGLSFGVFTLTFLLIAVSLWISNLFYLMIKNDQVTSVVNLSFLFVILFAIIIIRNEVTFSTGTRTQFATLSEKYVEYQNSSMEALGLLEVAEISGKDIFNGKCIACHNFDKKIVGPPYNTVLGKYVDKHEDLVNFVLNPRKMNPDYPNMPNQGLKPKEAEAIADYIMSVYLENNKQ